MSPSKSSNDTLVLFRVSIGIVLIGLGLLLGGTLWMKHLYHLSTRGVSTTATVTAVGETRGSRMNSSSTLCAPTLRFQEGSAIRQHTLSVASTETCYRVGAKVEIRHLRNEHGKLDVMLVHWSSWMFPAIMLFVGLGFAGVGTFMARACRNTLHAKRR